MSPADSNPASVAKSALPAQNRSRDVLPFLQGALLALAVIYMVRLTKPVLLPVVAGLFLALILKPVHQALERLHIHRLAGASVILFLMAGSLATASAYLFEPAMGWIGEYPMHVARVEGKLRIILSPLERMVDAAEKVGQLTASLGSTTRRAIEVSGPASSTGFLEMAESIAAQAAVALLILFFLLAYRKSIYTKLADQRETQTVIREIGRGISAYLFTITAINCALGLVQAVAMSALGMPNPLLWGAMCAVLTFIPYVGSLAGTVIVFLVALTAFDSVVRIVSVPIVYFAFTCLEGGFVTPMILGERFRVNPIVIFLWLIFWSWMWGVAGALLAVPLLMAFKIICEHVPMLSRVGYFMRLD